MAIQTCLWFTVLKVTADVGSMYRQSANVVEAPTSLTNGPPFIEMQCEWILSVIQKQMKESIATVEAKEEAQIAWREHCLDLASKTLAVHTDSWYMGAKYDPL